MRNSGSETVYVSLVDIGVSGRTTLLTAVSDGGHQVPPGRDYVYGRKGLDGHVAGRRLSLPESLDPALARHETLLVFVTSGPQDLRALEHPGIVHTRAIRRKGRPSPLQDLIDQLAIGWMRELDPEGDEGVRYDVHAIDFDLRGTAS